MRVIGITGGIGSGKSEILAYLREKYNARTDRADDIGRELMEPGTDCFYAIVERFGPACVSEEGRLRRDWISRRVFEDERALEELNAIIHPAVRREVVQRIEDAKTSGYAFYFLEAALLVETHYDEICDELWYIYADVETRLARLSQGERGVPRKKALQVMKSQLSDGMFRESCDFVVDNSGSFEAACAQIQKRMEQYQI